MKAILLDKAKVIRSKNAGPYELTFDMMFETANDMWDFFDSLNAARVSQQLGVEPAAIRNIIAFPPAMAVKITILRPRPSGDPGETDVYGAQQHAPWLHYSYETEDNDAAH